MELKQLYYLSVCAETQSFTKAANVLFTAQSNVSKVIRSLEEELGFELFERKQYGITLTPQGKLVNEQARETLRCARRIFELSDFGIKEQLRICANPGSDLANLFCEYYKKHAREDAHYSYYAASTNHIIERLDQRVDQLGLIYVPEGELALLKNRLEKAHLFFTPIKKTKLVLYTGSKMNCPEGERISLIQNDEDDLTLKSYWNKQSESQTDAADYRVAVTTNSDQVMHTLLEDTDLGHIGEESLLPEIKDDAKRSISLYKDENPVIFGIVSRNDTNMEELPRQFMQFVKKQVSMTDNREEERK